MNEKETARLYADAQTIYKECLSACLPDTAVERALKEIPPPPGKTVLIAIGKAAWQMANAAHRKLGDGISGVVITKYGHSGGEIGSLQICEAGHPMPDENSVKATAAAIEAVKDLGEKDQVLFLVSGGGSALFELPLIPLEELQGITQQLLACGADIVEINTIRKRLSAVKGGRFAKLCAPAKVYSVILSDIIGDPLDMIASGPTFPDTTERGKAEDIVEKYGLLLSAEAKRALQEDLPKELPNAKCFVTGSVKELCRAAAEASSHLGYKTTILTDTLCCEAKDAGSFLASIAKSHAGDGCAKAFIAGGETVVHLSGKGKGGRNQELAISAAAGIAGIKNVVIFSIGSDGTDGPTDAAGGIVDGETEDKLKQNGLSVAQVLKDNDAYHALEKVEGLIITGPTGTNVNDVAVVLLGT